MSTTNRYILYAKVSDGGTISTMELLPVDADRPDDLAMMALGSVEIDPLAGQGLLHHLEAHFAHTDTIYDKLPRYWTAASDEPGSIQTRTPAMDYAVDMTAKTPASTDLVTGQGTNTGGAVAGQGFDTTNVDERANTLTQAQAEERARKVAEQSSGVVANDPAAYVAPVRQSATDPRLTGGAGAPDSSKDAKTPVQPQSNTEQPAGGN